MGKHRSPRPKVSNPTSPDNLPDARPLPPDLPFDLKFGVLQEDMGLVNALIYAAQEHFLKYEWQCSRPNRGEERPIEHLDNLLMGARAAVSTVVRRGHTFARLLMDDPDSAKTRHALGVLSDHLGVAEALVSATLHHFLEYGWRSCPKGEGGESSLEHLHQLLAAAQTAARAAVRRGHAFAEAHLAPSRLVVVS
jgi:hypothetical protein